MRRSSKVLLACVGASALSAVACSETASSSAAPAPDASSIGDARAATDASSIGDAGEATDAPVSAGQLLRGQNLYLWTATDDGQLIYSDGSANELRVVPASAPAAAPVKLLPLAPSSSPYVYAPSKVVLVSPSLDVLEGPLSAWSASSGTVPLTPLSNLYRRAGASSDGRYVVYNVVKQVAGVTTSLDVVAMDLTTKTQTTLGTGYNATQTCRLRIEGPFAARFVVSGCAAGNSVRVTKSFDSSASFAAVTLLDAGSPRNFVVWNAGRTHVGLLVATDGGSGPAVVVPVQGGNAVSIGASVDTVFLNADASKVVYRDQAGALYVASMSAGSPQRLTSDGSTLSLNEPSADFRYSQVTTKSQSQAADDAGAQYATTDVQVVSLADGALIPLLDAPTGTTGEFTADSAFALYYDQVGSTRLGTLFARPVAGGASRELGKHVSNEEAHGGSVVVIDDNYAGAPFYAFGAEMDVHVADLVRADPPRLLAAGTSTGKIVQPNLKKVFYSVIAPAAAAGIYAVDLP